MARVTILLLIGTSGRFSLVNSNFRCRAIEAAHQLVTQRQQKRDFVPCGRTGHVNWLSIRRDSGALVPSTGRRLLDYFRSCYFLDDGQLGVPGRLYSRASLLIRVRAAADR